MSREKWTSAEVECVICESEWVAVFPFTPPDNFPPSLECPDCGHMNESELERIKQIILSEEAGQ